MERPEYEAFADRQVREQWRVEAVDHDSEGECYVAIFCGPGAEERAREYADWKNATGGLPRHDAFPAPEEVPCNVANS